MLLNTNLTLIGVIMCVVIFHTSKGSHLNKVVSGHCNLKGLTFDHYNLIIILVQI